jgi:hypothetical protein
VERCLRALDLPADTGYPSERACRAVHDRSECGQNNIREEAEGFH